MKVVSDILEVDPSTYGLSFRDAAIIAALAFFMLGLRDSAKFWRSTLSGRNGAADWSQPGGSGHALDARS